jgi:hypothetical protein
MSMYSGKIVMYVIVQLACTVILPPEVNCVPAAFMKYEAQIGKTRDGRKPPAQSADPMVLEMALIKQNGCRSEAVLQKRGVIDVSSYWMI